MSSGGSTSAQRGPRPRLFKRDRCQADACPADLSASPWYNRRNHICDAHKSAVGFARMGAPARFCQRCGVAHPAGDFDGAKKSCRRLLQRHNARRRKAEASPASSRREGSPPAGAAPEREATSQPMPRFLAAAAALDTAAPAVDDSQRVCRAGGDERVCGARAAGLDAVGPAAGPALSDAGSAAPGAAGGERGGRGAAPQDDPNALHGAGDRPVSGAPPPAALAPALAALRERDAALYAALVRHQLLQAHAMLSAAAGLLLQALPAPLVACA